MRNDNPKGFRERYKSNNPRGLTRKLFATYPDLKKRAIALVKQGHPISTVAFNIGVSQRIVDYWVKGYIPHRPEVTYPLLEQTAKKVDRALTEMESMPAPLPRQASKRRSTSEEKVKIYA